LAVYIIHIIAPKRSNFIITPWNKARKDTIPSHTCSKMCSISIHWKILAGLYDTRLYILSKL